MSYHVEFKSRAKRQLGELPVSLRKRVAEKIDALVNDARPKGSKKLHGDRSIYRVRVGDYRVVYYVDDQFERVVVLKVGHRRDVYRA